VPLLQCAQQVVRPDLPLWLGPIPPPLILSERLVESLIAGGFEAEKINMCNHSASMKFAEWTIEAVMNFMASSVLVITKGWSGKEKSLFDTEFRKNFMKARERAEADTSA
jgi:hypothetical protein